jgi:NAD(P)-dependent dehydrogenase (short-subunit alcohol dehydrogenase family)
MGARGGSIINISSIAGLMGAAGQIAYHASKGSVRLMTKCAAGNSQGSAVVLNIDINIAIEIRNIK